MTHKSSYTPNNWEESLKYPWVKEEISIKIMNYQEIEAETFYTKTCETWLKLYQEEN